MAGRVWCISVSETQLGKIIAYIDKLERHHHKIKFKKEYIGLLDSYKIEFDEKYLFEWFDQTNAFQLKKQPSSGCFFCYPDLSIN